MHVMYQQIIGMVPAECCQETSIGVMLASLPARSVYKKDIYINKTVCPIKVRKLIYWFQINKINVT